jgi:hypothetical protein
MESSLYRIDGNRYFVVICVYIVDCFNPASGKQSAAYFMAGKYAVCLKSKKPIQTNGQLFITFA